MDRELGNAAFSPAVSSPAIQSASKDRPAVLSAAFLTSGVAAGVILVWLFQKNIIRSLWPNNAELKPSIELALAVAGFSLFLVVAFLLIEKRRKILERRLECRNLAGSDDGLQLVVRKGADAYELASALNGARQAFAKAALLKAAIEEDGAILLEDLPQEPQFSTLPARRKSNG